MNIVLIRNNWQWLLLPVMACACYSAIAATTVTNLDADLRMEIPSLTFHGDGGDSTESATLELSNLGPGCGPPSDLGTGDPCGLADELIWEVTTTSSTWPVTPAGPFELPLDHTQINACRAETAPVLEASFRLCIPQLDVAGQAELYWAVFQFDNSLAGRLFFRLQAFGLITDPAAVADVETSPDEEEFIEPVPPSNLTLEWPALVGLPDGGETRQNSYTVGLELTNQTGSAIKLKLNVLLDLGSPDRLGKLQPVLDLDPEATYMLDIPLDDFGYDLSQMLYSGELSVLVQVLDPVSGELLESISSPPLYWHADAASNELVLYDHDTLRNVYRGGDFDASVPDGELFEPGVVLDRVVSPDSMVRISDPVMLFNNGFESLDNISSADEIPEDDELPEPPGSGSPDSPQATNLTTCVKWRIATSDSGRNISAGYPSSGQTEDQWPQCDAGCDATARGVLQRLKVGGITKEAYSNPATGCVAWTVNSIYSKFDLRVYTKSRDSNGNVIRVHDKPSSFLKYAGNVYAVDFKDLKLVNGTRNLVVGNTSDAKWVTMASTSFGLFRYNDGLSNKLLNIGMDYNNCGASSAHYGSSNAKITSGRHFLTVGSAINFCGAGGAQGRSKFVVTHELGHALAALFYGSAQNAVNGGEPNVLTNLSTVGDTCDFNGGSSYTIYSKEWSSVAYREGFAHFVAAKIWNNKSATGRFSWMGTIVDLEAFSPANSPGGYGVNVCGPPLIQRGIIADWMRFFWDFYTNADGACPSQPTKLDMFELYRQTRFKTPLTFGYFPALKTAATEIGLPACLSSSRFDVYAAHNGIDN